MSIRRKVLSWFALSIAAVIGFITLYTAFEYTLVSEVRERITGAQNKEGVELGQLLFETRGCSACHTLGGLSTSNIGPDLTEIALVASEIQIAESIVNPDAEISTNCGSQSCPDGLMPKFGDILDEREIKALVAFLSKYGRGEDEVRD